jgi:hypothetical protein
MTRSLPALPSLRFLREQAKDLLKAHGRGAADACATLRRLNRFAAADDATILAAEVALHEAQFALAMDYGFASWPALKAHVERCARAGAAAGDAGDPAGRRVLTGVPRVGYHRRLSPFPGCVEAVLEYLGHPVPYDDLMALSGAAFRRFWNRDDGGNIDLMYLHPEPHRRLFAALGVAYHHVPRERDALIGAVRNSLAAGRPVIAFGIIGPPEAGLICGCSDDGAVMLGHSYFDFARGPDGGYYELADWFEQMSPHSLGALIIDGFGPRPAPRATLIDTLDWAVQLARTPRRANLPNHVCGLAAYDAWAQALVIDADYPAGDASVLETRAMVHCDQAVMVMERSHAAAWLRRMVEHAPIAATALRAAAELYGRIGSLDVWRWGAQHYGTPEVQQGLAEAATRREIAALVRTAGRLEAEAVGHLEDALRTLRAED